MAKRWVDLDNWRHKPRKSDAAPSAGVASVYRARVATIRASIEATEARLRNPSIEPEDIAGEEKRLAMLRAVLQRAET
jgi:ribosomal protein S12 methylthiotransferase accessory factor YcaO